MRIACFLLVLILLPAPAFAEADFSVDCDSIHAMYVRNHPGGWDVLVQLTPEASREFQRFTQQYLGEVVAVTYPGGVYARARVQAPIKSGMMTTTLATEQAARDLVDAICPSGLKRQPVEPSTATPSAVYDVSCSNVVKIRIVRVDATHWNIESYKGFFHVLGLDLKDDAANGFVKFRNAAPTRHIRDGSEVILKKAIVVTANGTPLRNDDPDMTGFADQGINIAIIREEDAFEAARAVCPDLVPDKVLIDGHWE